MESADDMVSKATDLEELGCGVCKWRSKGVCKRYPPVWATPQPLFDKATGAVNGTTIGGWSFPPSLRKCGEFKNRAED